MRAVFFSVLLLPFLCACAASKLDIIQVGPWFPAVNWREVEVFSSRSGIVRPWGAIAILHSPRVGAAAGEARLEKLKEGTRRAAAGLGADAVIITVEAAAEDPGMGVYREPEQYISALAIKYVTASSTTAAK